MTEVQGLTLWSAILGAVGSAIMFFGSYALQPFEGATWGTDETEANNNKIRKNNKRRLWAQRIGLGFLFVAFLLQGLSAFRLD